MPVEVDLKLEGRGVLKTGKNDVSYLYATEVGLFKWGEALKVKLGQKVEKA